MNRKIRVSLVAMLIVGLFLIHTNSAFGQRVKVNFQIQPEGEQFSDLFPMKAPLHAVKVIVLAHSECCSPSWADDYYVKDMNGNILDELRNLEDLGIKEGDRLFVIPW